MSELKGCDSYDLPVDVGRCGDDERREREREREAGKSNGENKKNKKNHKRNSVSEADSPSQKQGSHIPSRCTPTMLNVSK